MCVCVCVWMCASACLCDCALYVMVVQDDSPDHHVVLVVSSTRWGGVDRDGDVVVADSDDSGISATAVLKYD